MLHNFNYPLEGLDMIPVWNEYVEGVVNNSELPKPIKRKMLSKRCILKINNSIYYLEEKEHKIEFLSYKSWLLQYERNRKIDQVLNGNNIT